MSIAGGYYKAVEEARRRGCDVVQIFTKNNSQWRAKPLTDQDAQLFQDALREQRIQHPLAHTSYLINLASVSPELWKKSVDAYVEEVRRAHHLGVPNLVLHPGAHTTATPEEGLANVVRGLNEAHRRTAKTPTRCLLENTAGQGTTLGRRFEELAVILSGVRRPERVGVCIDTCHLFAAGYPLSSKQDYDNTMAELDDLIGIDQVKAIHLNDSKRALGSRVDRHEHIGRGEMGLAPFRHLLNDPRFAETPMYLETKKGEHEGRSWDEINLETLRRLIKK